MEISRELAIQILKYCDEHEDFYFPFLVIHRGISIESYEWEIVRDNKKYQKFKLYENLQDLYPETVVLMSRGFIERITGNTLENAENNGDTLIQKSAVE